MSKIDVERLLNIGISFSSEKDFRKLLDLILAEARRITDSDAGTLYLVVSDTLVFKVMHNDTLKLYRGSQGEEILYPPVVLNRNIPPQQIENVSAYVAITGKTVNIDDVYQSSKFNFSGPKKYDAITGYHTQSMMVVPLENNKSEIIGVLQLLNAKNKKGKTVPFDLQNERVVLSLASQAAVALTNMEYTKDITELFNSFVKVMSTAIDERTPYNSNHTKNITVYATRLIAYINTQYDLGLYSEHFDENRKSQLIMSAWLHDIGKIVTPLGVMNKTTRLGKHLQPLLQRFSLIKAALYISYLEGEIDGTVYEDQLEELAHAQTRICQVNTSGFVSQEDVKYMQSLAQKKYLDIDGNTAPWLSDVELNFLCIPKGNLTEEERKIMKEHVVVTERLLSKIKFNKEFKDVPLFASSHHEFLDGSGYPKQLSGSNIPLESRILTVLDIFEALTAEDRPYKKSMSVPSAISILYSMAEENKLDKGLVQMLEQSNAWENCDPIKA